MQRLFVPCSAESGGAVLEFCEEWWSSHCKKLPGRFSKLLFRRIDGGLFRHARRCIKQSVRFRRGMLRRAVIRYRLSDAAPEQRRYAVSII